MTLRSLRGAFLLGAVLAAISCAEEPGTPGDPGGEPDPNLANNPPVARCRNVTVTATNTCVLPASINDGSSDPDGDLVGCTQSAAGPYGLGTTTVTLRCTDQGGRASTCTGTVTVTDGVLPVVNVSPRTQTAQCTRGSAYNYLSGVNGSDLCEGLLPPGNISWTGTVNLGQTGSSTVTYQARDSSNNLSAPVSRTVNVVDTLPPLLSMLGNTTMPAECGLPFNDPGAIASDVCLGPITSSIVRTGTVNTAVLGSYSLRYDVSDGTNAAAPKTRTVIVSDTRTPTVTLVGPLSVTAECNGPFTDPGATATDLCAGTLQAFPTNPPNLSQPGSYSTQYMATDPSGNRATPSQFRVISVFDTLPPTVTLNGSSTVALECASPFQDPGATAQDQCTGPRTVIASGTVDPLTPGVQTITYTAGDGYGNTGTATRTVTVSDTLPPTVMLNGPANMALECATPFEDPGATANDQCAGPRPVTASGTVDPFVTGMQTVTYTASDGSGHDATATRAVTVSDTLPPTLTLNGPANLAVECAPTFQDPGATASDLCTGSRPVTTAGTVNPRQLGSQTLTYSADDGNGHTVSATRAVTVSDTLPPTLALNGSANMVLECAFPFQDPGATATDQCTGSQSVTVSGTVNPRQLGAQTLTYSASDGNGHTATATRTVTVRDRLAPVIEMFGPASIALECNGPPYVDPGSIAWDTCAGDLTSAMTVTSNLNQSQSGQYTVTYAVDDGAGHVRTATRQLTVGHCVVCTQIRLSEYNLFLLESYNGGHDVEGKVAAGRDITMTNFAVGAGVAGNNISNTLVAGGNLSLAHGGIWGDAWYGGTYSADQDVTSHRGAVARGSPINFPARFAELRNVSSQLDALPATGTTTADGFGNMLTRGTDPFLNVFDMNTSLFASAETWTIDAPAGSLVVINIHGASATFTGFGIAFIGGIDQHGVIYNFVDTTTIQAQNFGFWGTILAPLANITFINGSWDGGIYARSLTGNGEGHINPVPDRDVCQ
jgi:large repetitive protein